MKESIPEQTPPPPIHFHPKIWLPILIAVVAVAGYLAWANAQQQWPFGGESEERIVNSNKQDETANWKIYRNEEYGFEIKHPTSLFLSESAFSENGGFFYVGFSMLSKVDSEPVVTVKIYPNQATLEKFISYFDYLRADWEDTQVGGVDAKKTISTGKNSEQFVLAVLVYGGNGYEIASTLFGDNKANINITNQILSTFKFTHTP